ncbi:MAG: hypothetical protein PHR83_00170 [Paludibacter sp.]|nr:hypothetical protein [Paludibacter sp.]
MKKLLFSFILLVIIQHATFAQYEYGTYYIDANVNLDLLNDKINNTTATSYRNNHIKVTPEIGYFIKNNIAIGIGFTYNNTLVSTINSPFTSFLNGDLAYKLIPVTTTELNEIAPVFFIKYFYQPTNKLSLSLKASYSKGWGRYNLIQKYIKEPQDQETIFKSVEDKIDSKYIYITPELQYLITSKLGLQINFNGFGYTSTTDYDNVFNLNGLNPNYSTSTITKYGHESTSLNIKPAAWSFGIFFLLN